MHVASGKKIQTGKIVARNQALNFIEQRLRIKWTQLGLEIACREPYRMAIGFARLGPATLSHIGTSSFSERNKPANIAAHAVGDADDQFEIGADAGNIASFLEL